MIWQCQKKPDLLLRTIPDSIWTVKNWFPGLFCSPRQKDNGKAYVAHSLCHGTLLWSDLPGWCPLPVRWPPLGRCCNAGRGQNNLPALCYPKWSCRHGIQSGWLILTPQKKQTSIRAGRLLWFVRWYLQFLLKYRWINRNCSWRRDQTQENKLHKKRRAVRFRRGLIAIVFAIRSPFF